MSNNVILLNAQFCTHAVSTYT